MPFSSSHVRIDLAPKAGFCVKSSTLTPAVLPPPHRSPSTSKQADSASLLEPPPGPIQVPTGQKTFVNIAWDPKVPPPPEGSEDAIQKAMQGEDMDENNPSGWYVPVIVSHARQDTDKLGNPSLVFDCIYNSTVKSRTLRDPEFKIFLIELALQRIEAQTGLNLSRNIGTPNIASKGKLLPRTVQVPTALFPALTGAPSSSPSQSSSSKSKLPLIQDLSEPTPASPNSATANQGPKKEPLVQEVAPPSVSTSNAANRGDSQQRKGAAIESGAGGSFTRSHASSSLPGLRGILKKPATAASSGSTTANGKEGAGAAGAGSGAHVDANAPLDWSWRKDHAARLRIEVHLPGLTPTLVQHSTLDVEPRRIILAIPGRRTLDIDLALSDGEIVARTNIAYSSASPSPASLSSAAAKVNAAAAAEMEKEKRKEEETKQALQLKRQRDFDVDNAEAEWKVGTGEVVIWV